MKHLLISLFGRKSKPGFTIVEIAIVIAALGIAAAVTVPSYQRYQIRNNVQTARQNVAQGIERAKLLSQVGMNDSKWGFSTDSVPGRGVLFMGESFAERDPAYDEMYSLPSNITVTGLTEVTFEKITGVPSQTGEIVLSSQYDDEVTITVNLGEDGQVDIPEDWLEVCLDPFTEDQQTIRVPDSLWAEYQNDGAELGGCSDFIPSSSSESSESSSSESSESSGSSDSSDGTDFTIDVNGTVTYNNDYTFSAEVIGTALTISSGYEAPITVRFKVSGEPFEEPWGDFTKPVDGNVNKSGDYTHESDTILAGRSLDIWARSYYKKKWYYSGNSNNHFNQQLQVRTETADTQVEVLVDGDIVPNYEGAGNQDSVEEFLGDYIDPDTGLIDIGANQVIYLFELWTTNLNSSSADFQDLVLLVSFQDA